MPRASRKTRERRRCKPAARRSRSGSAKVPPARRAREHEALHALANRVGAAASIPVICRTATRLVTRLLGYEGAVVLLLSGSEGEETLELVAREGRIPESLLGALGGPPGGLERQALRTRKPCIVRAGDGAESAAMVPIVAGRRAWGIVGVVGADAEHLDERALSVLTEVGRTVGIGLERRHVLELAHRQVEDIRFFRDVSAWIAGTIDLDRLLERICRNLSELIDVPQCFILLHDADAKVLYCVAGTGTPERLIQGIRIPTSTRRSLAVRVFKSRRPTAIYDAANDPRPNQRLVRLLKETSLLALPLLVRGEGIGSVMLGETRRLRRFDAEEVARAQTVVNQAALAIENALRHRDAVAARHRAEVLLETVRDVSSSIDFHEAMRRIARRTVQMTSASRCTVFLPDEGGRRLIDLVDHGTPRHLRVHLNALKGRDFADFSAGREVLRARRPILYDDIGAEGGVSQAMAKQLGLRAAVIVPVRAHGKFVAAFAVAYPPSVKSPPRDEVKLVEGVAYQIALAVENSRAFDEIGRQRLALDHLTTRMIGAQEEERRRIARELHDGVSQTLTAVKFELERVARRAGASGEINHAATLLGEAIGEVRRLCMDLRPSQLDHLGLYATVEWYVKRFAKRAGLEVDVVLPETAPPPLSPDTEINLYRIVQEALSNIVQHAGATRASVKIRVNPRRLFIAIADDGRGFDRARVEREHAEDRGMGLLTMSERAHLLHGELSVRSNEGRGTTVQVSVPLKPASKAAALPAATTTPPVVATP